MALAGIIVITFLFPTVVVLMIWYWGRSVKKRVDEKEKEHSELVSIIEKVVAAKDSIIRTMKQKW